MVLKLEFGKAFVSKAFIQDNRIFDGAALYETKFEDDHFELDLYEFFSLVALHSLSFQVNGYEERFSAPEQIFSWLNVTDSRQRLLFQLHLDLKRKGWRIRRGLNYGADFLLYDSDPNMVHSKYAVYLFNEPYSSEWNSIAAMNRVCSTARKTMLIAIPTHGSEEVFQYIQLKRWVPESNRE